MKLVALGVLVKTALSLNDETAEPLALDIERRIERAAEQIVKDMSHASGVEMSVEFN